jgi:hypothetical protein
VSTTDSILSNPYSAFSILFLPSIVKGSVTTPIVSAPCFFANPAIIGAAPVPVLWTTNPSDIKLWLPSTVISYTSSSPISQIDSTLLKPKCLKKSGVSLLLNLYKKFGQFLAFECTNSPNNC